MKINKLHIIGIVCFLLGAASCSTTRNLPEDELLYRGIKKIDVLSQDESGNGEQALEEITAAVTQTTKYGFILPYRLWAYNSFEKYEKGVGKWIFKKIAADPVYLSTVNPSTRTKVASNLLHDYGYFDGKVTYQVDTLKNPKEIKVSYQIDMGKPYYIDTLTYEKFSPFADSLIRRSDSQRLIHSGDHFNVLRLNEERQRIIDLLRDNGYYYARTDFLTILADTIMRPGYVSLKIVPKSNIPQEALRTYRLGHTSVYLTGYNGERPTDSLQLRDFTIYYAGKKPGIKYGVLRKRFIYRSGEKYSQLRQNYTQEALARLGVFKFSEFQYTPRSNGGDTLDIRVNAMFDLPYNSELELNVKTKSTKQTGPGAFFSLSRRNFRRMGASLNLELRGSYEWQTSSTVDGESSVMNSYELGTSLSLEFPRLVLPWIRDRIDPFRFPSQTNFKIYAEQVNRARYFKMLSFGGTVSYSFQPSRSMKHTVTPLHLAFNHLQRRTAAFDSIAEANPMLFHSLSDQFIPSVTYTFTYDNSWMKKRIRTWWENSITSAGNVTSLIYMACGKGFNTRDKEFLGTPFAQFLKFTSEIRPLYQISEKQQLAGRFMAGVVWAYGNKTIAPYNEQFYVGGANSIRAFTIRSIGPGRFHPSENSSYSYVDETGDIKLEANLEYRFRMMSNLFGGNLNGAVFLDAGNVWLMRKDEARPGAEFTFSKFFDNWAVGTGIGIRYDLSFLILRLDWGIALHVPYETGKRGYYNIPNFKDGMGIHFAIGYPF
ncbi:BamA/TamA family outer membrane protein [Phocaeicola faecicola]|uniref:translocation and assembly module lipoprotein TamL n=1 Tax=Phocaeicola faecicola TaxID=2739389 RepID=UPI002A7F07F0|nr:BamA/TamA family outer membrane protein [Phocaeicola faecicola]MDD6907339.1 BamA/TamA family outer membrane protein [Bacteroidaceae bacterium]MDY4873130.1 BamA/TamA family outer membrane protein [Phocaeicola faecicola]